MKNKTDKHDINFIILLTTMCVLSIVANINLYAVQKNMQQSIIELNEIILFGASTSISSSYWESQAATTPEVMQSYFEGKIKNATGLYVPNCGFWVDTRGRYIEQVEKTYNHEAAHALILQTNNSYDHFCGNHSYVVKQ